MQKLYSISIHGRFASILVVGKRAKGHFEILSEDTIEVEKLQAYMSNKKNLYIALDLEEVLDDIVIVPSNIKNSKLLQGYINKRFHEIINSKKIILNYTKLVQDKEKSTVTYKVDAILEEEYSQKISFIEDYKVVKSITIDKFALFSLAKRCYKATNGKGYLVVHTYGNDISILAINEKNDLIFERKGSTALSDREFRYLNISEEIIQTVAYIKQQFRTLEFSTIFLSGSLTIDESAGEHLYVSTGLSVAVLYPNTFISGLVANEPQSHIISLGSFLVEKSERFITDKIYSQKEFYLISNAILGISFICLLMGAYLFLDSYEKYNDKIERYENIKDRLVKTIKKVKTLSTHSLKNYNLFLDIRDKYATQNPFDFLITLKPLIQIIKPKNFSYTKYPSAIFRIEFQKKFYTLNDLYEFEKSFFKKFKEIDKKGLFEYKNITDYGKLIFAVKISTLIRKRKKPLMHRRRRR